MIDVFPTPWSPRNTNLYFVKAEILVTGATPLGSGWSSRPSLEADAMLLARVALKTTAPGRGQVPYPLPVSGKWWSRRPVEANRKYLKKKTSFISHRPKMIIFWNIGINRDDFWFYDESEGIKYLGLWSLLVVIPVSSLCCSVLQVGMTLLLVKPMIDNRCNTRDKPACADIMSTTVLFVATISQRSQCDLGPTNLKWCC